MKVRLVYPDVSCSRTENLLLNCCSFISGLGNLATFSVVKMLCAIFGVFDLYVLWLSRLNCSSQVARSKWWHVLYQVSFFHSVTALFLPGNPREQRNCCFTFGPNCFFFKLWEWENSFQKLPPKAEVWNFIHLSILALVFSRENIRVNYRLCINSLHQISESCGSQEEESVVFVPHFLSRLISKKYVVKAGFECRHLKDRKIHKPCS